MFCLSFIFNSFPRVRIASVQEVGRNESHAVHKARSSQNKRKRKAVTSTSLDPAITSGVMSFLKVLIRQILDKTCKYLGDLIGVTKQEIEDILEKMK